LNKNVVQEKMRNFKNLGKQGENTLETSVVLKSGENEAVRSQKIALVLSSMGSAVQSIEKHAKDKMKTVQNLVLNLGEKSTMIDISIVSW
jgi:hypothetical protein